jgi:hypothetical protein
MSDKRFALRSGYSRIGAQRGKIVRALWKLG